uniref:Uncharacterized protein n=1 Tax=Chromera velia CCMP2878 TaxID=1169474 RepID=A0A0G4I920_9ALVE|eukprot:Cvel_12053.t1-p1 / transcript=Cvel_12053.t1 / gene=Cvel_12053 / organism=Chromera_velia_CCMP2878 / gene_product=hypothetical protein / transcript_product=hypothetical protein / location=Cvel_scaffold774:57478-59948(+) / protein_length=449 / sequence_SO=supercontig / SO=protein_coding / is_pseudo=false
MSAGVSKAAIKAGKRTPIQTKKTKTVKPVTGPRALPTPQSKATRSNSRVGVVSLSPAVASEFSHNKGAGEKETASMMETNNAEQAVVLDGYIQTEVSKGVDLEGELSHTEETTVDGTPRNAATADTAMGGDSEVHNASGDPVQPTLEARSVLESDALVVFDWDDTLLPSRWLDFRGCTPPNGPMSVDPLFPRERMELHQVDKRAAAALEAVVRRGGTVMIITNAERQWVFNTAHTFLPSVASVLYNYQIQVVSARDEHAHRWRGLNQVWQSSMWKEASFSFEMRRFLWGFPQTSPPSLGAPPGVWQGCDCVDEDEMPPAAGDDDDEGKFCHCTCEQTIGSWRLLPPLPRREEETGRPRDVTFISVGDSQHERMALKTGIQRIRKWGEKTGSRLSVWMKSLKFMVTPSALQVSEQLWEFEKALDSLMVMRQDSDLKSNEIGEACVWRKRE